MCNCATNCQSCPKFIATTAVAITGGNLTLTIPTQQLLQGQKLCLLIQQSIPAGSDGLPVVITNGNTNVAVIGRCGNSIFGDQLRSRRIYNATVGVSPAHVTITSNNLCRTAKILPPITPATTAANA